jgi:hypothetical protein
MKLILFHIAAAALFVPVAPLFSAPTGPYGSVVECAFDQVLVQGLNAGTTCSVNALIK